jgi:hypothetical protein
MVSPEQSWRQTSIIVSRFLARFWQEQSFFTFGYCFDVLPSYWQRYVYTLWTDQLYQAEGLPRLLPVRFPHPRFSFSWGGALFKKCSLWILRFVGALLNNAAPVYEKEKWLLSNIYLSLPLLEIRATSCSRLRFRLYEPWDDASIDAKDQWALTRTWESASYILRTSA